MRAEEPVGACWGDVFVLELESGTEGFRCAVVGAGASPGAEAPLSRLSTASVDFLFFFLAIFMAPGMVRLYHLGLEQLPGKQWHGE